MLLGPDYEEAVRIAQSAIDSERRQLPHTAIGAYIQAGQLLIEIGRRQAAPHLQEIVKAKALALLQRAEGLSEWTNAVLAKDSSQHALAEAYQQSQQNRYKSMTEKQELVSKMQQDNKNMKEKLSQLALLTKIRGHMKRAVSNHRARKAAQAQTQAESNAQAAAEATQEIMTRRGGFNDVTGEVNEDQQRRETYDGPNDVTGSEEKEEEGGYSKLFPRAPPVQAAGGSPRETQKVELINELHARIGLPQIGHLRKFEPLTRDPMADGKQEELQAELEAAKNEADQLRAAMQEMEQCLQLAAQHQKQRTIKLEQQKVQEFAQVHDELERVREELESERQCRAVALCICEPCHVCEFNVLSGICDYIYRPGLDLSDGSSLAVDQPLLTPTDWFLTEEEITASRGGSPRSGMATYTTGNDVETYSVTKEYFDAVFEDLTTTKEGDRVMMSAWTTDKVPLQPDVDNGSKSQFLDVVVGVIERGGSFKALVWTNKMEALPNIAVRNDMNAIPASSETGEKPLFIFDDRVTSPTASHHQKNIIIASANSTGENDQPVAYVGGIDITSDRWDTPYHNVSAIRDAAGVNSDYDGWLDAHVRIHGPAAKDVATNFLARWNSDYLPTQGLIDDLVNYENPPYSDLAPLNYVSSTTNSSLGHQNVQIVRTFSCKYKHYKEFAPYGEKSLFQARIKALKNAKNYIYIEDQYFILVPELLDVILEVMPTIQRLIVIVEPPSTGLKITGYEKYLFDMVAPIQQLYPNKFQLYTTKSVRNLYIHTKIVVIDDVYLSVGSANWNRRSMTSDSELDANIIDDLTMGSPDGITVLKAARDFRIRKFHEMTGLSYEELDALTFIDAANQLDVAAADNSTIIETFQVEKHTYFAAYTNIIREAADPDDVCDAS
ncbi:hypothetical protein JM16_008019 [Phytophthora kernoviae]|uniref:phospholipase D n=2 Tax=Phytophthora kernoviae TaxID=325452 RepID=A0A8T0LMK6_9STRA|nr:hypothetical protein JM16_008019 [Phytophthora kernoviae]